MRSRYDKSDGYNSREEISRLCGLRKCSGGNGEWRLMKEINHSVRLAPRAPSLNSLGNPQMRL